MPYLITDGSEKIELPIQFKRVYAKAKTVLEMGLYYTREPELIKCVTLTTWDKAEIQKGKRKGGNRNTWKLMVRDIGELRRRMKNDGYACESCFCAEISPEKGLIHVHGFMRFEKYYTMVEIHEIVSELWSKIHSSPVVWVKDMWDLKGAIAYDCKHNLKNYVSERYLFGGKPPRILKSKGWLPKNYRAVEKELKRSMSEAVDWYPEDGEEVTPEYWNKRYIPLKWEFMKSEIIRYLRGDDIWINRDSGVVIANQQGLIVLEYETEND